MNQLEPLLWRSMDVRPIRDYALMSESPSPSASAASSVVPVSMEVIGALSTRRFWLQHIIKEFEGPKQEAHRILRLIDDALGR